MHKFYYLKAKMEQLIKNEQEYLLGAKAIDGETQ
jgi:hypothetical protein